MAEAAGHGCRRSLSASDTADTAGENNRAGNNEGGTHISSDSSTARNTNTERRSNTAGNDSPKSRPPQNRRSRKRRRSDSSNRHKRPGAYRLRPESRLGANGVAVSERGMGTSKAFDRFFYYILDRKTRDRIAAVGRIGIPRWRTPNPYPRDRTMAMA
jgi:hypothetical protein